MRSISLLSAILSIPTIAAAQDIPVYLRSGNDLAYYGDTVTEDFAAELMGGSEAYSRLGRPDYIINQKGGQNLPVYGSSPESMEKLWGGDGTVVGAPDDLTFAENEGTKVDDDLDFSANEGTNTRVDMTFDEAEATPANDDLLFTENDASQPEDDLVFDENEGLLVVEDEEVPTEFFEASMGATITPIDGDWTVEILEAFATGCPPGIAEQARMQLLKKSSMSITFSKPDWHPSDLSAELAQDNWRKVGANGYFTYRYVTGPEASGSGMSVAISIAYVARKPTVIDMRYRVRARLTPALAAMAGSSTDCEAVIFAEVTKQN